MCHSALKLEGMQQYLHLVGQRPAADLHLRPGGLGLARLTFLLLRHPVLWLSSSSFSFWSMVWWSVLYCVKVLSFSSLLFRAIKENMSAILNVTLLLTLLTSCLVFSRFLCLQSQSKTLAPTNTTDETSCIIRKPLFPASAVLLSCSNKNEAQSPDLQEKEHKHW